MIVLDTSVLSLAFRRRKGGAAEPEMVGHLRKMIEDDFPLGIPGIVLQELLSGVRDRNQFNRLDRLLGGFPLLIADADDHRRAAQIANACSAAGVSTSAPDCLIAAQSAGRGNALFTLDEDFRRMAPHCGLTLYPNQRFR